MLNLCMFSSFLLFKNYNLPKNKKFFLNKNKNKMPVDQYTLDCMEVIVNGSEKVFCGFLYNTNQKCSVVSNCQQLNCYIVASEQIIHTNTKSPKSYCSFVFDGELHTLERGTAVMVNGLVYRFCGFLANIDRGCSIIRSCADHLTCHIVATSELMPVFRTICL